MSKLLLSYHMWRSDILLLHDDILSIETYINRHNLKVDLTSAPDEWIETLFPEVVEHGPAAHEILNIRTLIARTDIIVEEDIREWLGSLECSTWRYLYRAFTNKKFDEIAPNGQSPIDRRNKYLSRIAMTSLATHRNMVSDYPIYFDISEMAAGSIFGLVYFNYYDKFIEPEDYIMVTYPMRKFYGPLQELDEKVVNTYGDFTIS